MNKLTKAGIAAAAGIALLMGGAGTLAYWNDTASVAGGTITAGKLDIVSTAAGTWSAANGAQTTTITNIANYRIVPGDVLTYTTDITVALEGDLLQTRLELAAGSIAAASSADPTQTIANQTLANSLNGNVVVAATTGAGITATATPGEYTIAKTVTTIPVTVTITFPKNAVAGYENGAMTGAVSFSGLGVTLRQI